MWIVEQKRRDRIGPSHLGLNRQIVHHAIAKADQVVSDKCDAGKQECGATNQHVHAGQFRCNRIVTDSKHYLSISGEGPFLTLVATLRSSELRVRPARCTATRLTSKRTRFASTTN